MGLKIVLLVFAMGGFLIPGFYCKSLNFANIIKGLPDTFAESEQSRALGWPAAPSAPRGLLPFYMIAEHLLDSLSGGGLKAKFQALQKSCGIKALAVILAPLLLGILAALAIIVLQVVNVILTALVLATNFGVTLTGKTLTLPRIANASVVQEFKQCNSQMLRLIKHNCEVQARDLNMVQLGDKEYYFSHSSIKMDWDDAQTFCRARCQQLVSIEDSVEETAIFDHLTALARSEGESIEPFWTSGSYKNGKYKWLATGRDFGYINLAPPRQHKRSQARQGTVDASCVGMASVKNETAWIGAPCEQMNRFVCEKPLQLAYRDHFLYEKMKMEEEAEAAAAAAAASTEAPTASVIVTPIPDDRINEVRRRG